MPRKTTAVLTEIASADLTEGYYENMTDNGIFSPTAETIDISEFTQTAEAPKKIKHLSEGVKIYRNIDELPGPEDLQDYVSTLFDAGEVRLLSRKVETGENVFRIGGKITLPNGETKDGFSILKCYTPTEYMSKKDGREASLKFSQQVKYAAFLGEYAEPYFPKIFSSSTDGLKRVEVRQLKECGTRMASRILGSEHYPFDLAYIAMEYGRNLSQVLDENRLSMQDKIDMALNVAKGLRFLHWYGFVHGDIKDGNIIINERGVAKTIDFGTMKWNGRIGGEFTPLYGAPAAIRAALYETDFSADTKNDMFSYGLLLYKMFTGVDYRKGKESPFEWMSIPGQETIKVYTGNEIADEKLNEIIVGTTRKKSLRYDAKQVVNALTGLQEKLGYKAAAAA